MHCMLTRDNKELCDVDVTHVGRIAGRVCIGRVAVHHVLTGWRHATTRKLFLHRRLELVVGALPRRQDAVNADLASPAENDAAEHQLRDTHHHQQNRVLPTIAGLRNVFNRTARRTVLHELELSVLSIRRTMQINCRPTESII